MSRPRQVPALEWVVGTWLVKTLSKMIFVKLVSKISASVDLKQRQFPRTNSSRRAQPTLENSFTCLSFEIIIRKSIMKIKGILMHIKLEDLDENPFFAAFKIDYLSASLATEPNDNIFLKPRSLASKVFLSG